MIDIVSWPARFFVPPLKVTKYLLDSTSEEGSTKCAYFTSYGFTSLRPDELTLALYLHADMANFVSVIVAPYGLKFRFDGPMAAPNGRDATLMTIWQVKAGSDGTASFVTSRPSRR